jgi:hypothetical protein
MRLIVPAVAALVALFSSLVQAQGYSEAQYETIRQLGQLNGVALNCQYLNETRRMKKSLVVTLPKRRQLGELFDTETNSAFLQFIEERRECPTEASFSVQVDDAILALEKAFVDSE